MEQREVPKRLQNELFDKTKPFIEKIIAAHQKEQIGFSKFSLDNIALQAACIGYYHLSDNELAKLKEINESLLSALKGCREWFDKHGTDYEIGLPNCFIKAKEAISKASKQ